MLFGGGEGLRGAPAPQGMSLFLMETSVHLGYVWVWWETPVPPWESVCPADWGSPCAPEEWEGFCWGSLVPHSDA